ncbi:hypothetical protein C0J52_21927 [Blattella germanica]|nr:hypothetical protein C0J52_21927 [Blattella germanica]
MDAIVIMFSVIGVTIFVIFGICCTTCNKNQGPSSRSKKSNGSFGGDVEIGGFGVGDDGGGCDSGDGGGCDSGRGGGCDSGGGGGCDTGGGMCD